MPNTLTELTPRQLKDLIIEAIREERTMSEWGEKWVAGMELTRAVPKSAFIPGVQLPMPFDEPAPKPKRNHAKYYTEITVHLTENPDHLRPVELSTIYGLDKSYINHIIRELKVPSVAKVGKQSFYTEEDFANAYRIAYGEKRYERLIQRGATTNE